MAVVTGVLGVVPEEMWKAMPNYDSGVPNRWRVMEAVEDYFYWTNYEHVIVYSDFYSEAISIGLRAFHRSRVSYPLEEAGVHIRGESGYVDLLNKGNLDLLREAAYIGRNP